MRKAVQALNIVLFQAALQETSLVPFRIQDISLINTLAEVAKGVAHWRFSSFYVQGH